MGSYFPDLLRFPGGNNEMSDTTFEEMVRNQGSYYQHSVFQESNADLNSFFPRTGLTPLGTPGTGSFGGIQNYSWGDTQQQMPNMTGYLMPQNVTPQQIQSQMTIDPTTVNETGKKPTTDIQNTSNSTKADPDNEPVEFQKPKRGRPRKKRDKKKLTPEEENDKRQRFLERNRLAASKCRDRKKNWTQETMDKLSREERTHVELQIEYNRLHDEVASLMEAACEHLGHCGDRGTSFQDSLSMASDRIADIGRVYLSMGGRRGGEVHEDVQDEENPNNMNLDDPPAKQACSGRKREYSSPESVQSLEDSKDSTLAWNKQAHQGLDEKDPGWTQSPGMSRRSSAKSTGSSEDRDSAISARDSPAKSIFQLPTDEGFFGSDDSKSIIPLTCNDTLPVMIMDTGMVPKDAQTKLDGFLFSQNLALDSNMGSIKRNT